jgi:hypothetical protein
LATFKQLFAEEQARVRSQVFQIYQSLNMKDKSKEELLGAMILHDLKQKAETR